MNLHILRSLATAASLAAAISLLGCGGGSSTSDATTPVEPAPTPESPAPTLTVPTGMTASAVSGVQARNARDTIETLLPRPAIRFAPVSARSRTDGFHVTSISSDGNNGFSVTFVLRGQQSTVHFKADDFGTSSNSPNDYFIETPDGARFWLHGTLGSFDGEQRNLGSPYFEYHDIYSAGGSGHGATNRQYLAFGARTQDANLPVGTASYSGVVRAESHPTDSLESPGMRGRLEGNWRLSADFSESTLRGDIRLLVVRPPGGESGWRILPHTTYFRIENGQIVNGQFTASLSGVDSRPHPARDETVEGFEGGMLGEFYGPGGEEAGGVLRAARSSDNRVLTGAFGGKRMPELTPSLPAGDLSVQSVGIDRDYVATNVRTTDEVKVTAIESDGANGFHVTYRVDGTDHRVHLVEQIYVNRFDEFGLFNDQADGLFGLSDQTGSFAGTPEFSHFAVHGWAVGTYADDGTPRSTFRGFVVSGVPIEASGLPAGGATYAGRAHFLTWPSNNPRLAAQGRGDGRLVLTANFDASTVGGTIDRIGDVLGPIAEVAVQNGAIHDGQLTADLRGVQTGATFDGDMTGRFYGAGAAEVGGVLEGSLTHAQTATVVQGWFGGEKQQ